MQVKLLRAIQERSIRRVGGNEEVEIDVRIISATNKNLMESIQRDDFRLDLFYRLNVISINVPPLRERRDDIPLLMSYFLKDFSRKFEKNIEGFKKDVMDLFINYPWPGNVRELENFIERAVALEKTNMLNTSSLPTELVYNVSTYDINKMEKKDISSLLFDKDFVFSDYVDDISKKLIIKALELNNSNIKKAAEMLKLKYRSLRHLIEKYSLKAK